MKFPKDNQDGSIYVYVENIGDLEASTPMDLFCMQMLACHFERSGCILFASGTRFFARAQNDSWAAAQNDNDEVDAHNVIMGEYTFGQWWGEYLQ